MRLLDWLDRQRDALFWLVLYLARWVAIVPAVALQYWLYRNFSEAADATLGETEPIALAVGLVVLSPVVETLVECTAPYWVMYRGRADRPRRPWWFIGLSTTVMLVLHPLLAAPCTLVTGVFLAYCYAHFAIRSHWAALAATSLFHAAINLVGLVMILGGWGG